MTKRIQAKKKDRRVEGSTMNPGNKGGAFTLKKGDTPEAMKKSIDSSDAPEGSGSSLSITDKNAIDGAPLVDTRDKAFHKEEKESQTTIEDTNRKKINFKGNLLTKSRVDVSHTIHIQKELIVLSVRIDLGTSHPETLEPFRDLLSASYTETVFPTGDFSLVDGQYSVSVFPEMTSSQEGSSSITNMTVTFKPVADTDDDKKDYSSAQKSEEVGYATYHKEESLKPSKIFKRSSISEDVSNLEAFEEFHEACMEGAVTSLFTRLPELARQQYNRRQKFFTHLYEGKKA